MLPEVNIPHLTLKTRKGRSSLFFVYPAHDVKEFPHLVAAHGDYSEAVPRSLTYLSSTETEDRVVIAAQASSPVDSEIADLTSLAEAVKAALTKGGWLMQESISFDPRVFVIPQQSTIFSDSARDKTCQHCILNGLEIFLSK